MAAQLDMDQLGKALKNKERESDAAAARSKSGGLGSVGGKKKGKVHENPLERIPKLGNDFRLEPALQQAYSKAANYMNKVLNRSDLTIALEQKDGAVVGTVVDLETQRTVNQYNGEQILKLYAQNHYERGIVIDGRV